MRLGGKRVRLTLLSAAEVLRARRETLHLEQADGAELSLRLDAALLALSLRSGGERVFADAEQALDALSVGQIRRYAAAYERLDEGARLEELRAAAQEHEEQTQEKNESFDEERFARLKWGELPAREAPAQQDEAAQESVGVWVRQAEDTSAAPEAVHALSVQELSNAFERDARRYFCSVLGDGRCFLLVVTKDVQRRSQKLQRVVVAQITADITDGRIKSVICKRSPNSSRA